jgi:hypothetical protein
MKQEDVYVYSTGEGWGGNCCEIFQHLSGVTENHKKVRMFSTLVKTIT